MPLAPPALIRINSRTHRDGAAIWCGRQL